MDEKLTPQEEYRWKLFDLIEPIGDKRMDSLAALVCSFLAMSNVDPPNWGSGLRKFLPKEITVVEDANEMLAFFDSKIAPKVGPLKP